jgi:hypothetical protein
MATAPFGNNPAKIERYQTFWRPTGYGLCSACRSMKIRESTCCRLHRFLTRSDLP